MKALTIWQPYAQAFAAGLKKYETRSWPTRYRGPIAVHASVRKMNGEARQLAERYQLDISRYGEIIVLADVTDCLLMTDEFIKQQPQSEIDFGDWRTGRYAWKLENIRLPQQPMKISGRQGLWTLLLSDIG